VGYQPQPWATSEADKLIYELVVPRDVVSVSTSQSRDIVSKRLGLVETWEGLGLNLISD